MNSKKLTLNLTIGAGLMSLIIFVSHAKAIENGKILFESNNGIWSMNPNGSGRQILTDAGSSPEFSPDGTKIAFYRGGNIYLMNADGSNQTYLTFAGSDFGRDFVTSCRLTDKELLLLAKVFVLSTPMEAIGLSSAITTMITRRIGRPTGQKSSLRERLYSTIWIFG